MASETMQESEIAVGNDDAAILWHGDDPARSSWLMTQRTG
jgi:hypothetical protein